MNDSHRRNMDCPAFEPMEPRLLLDAVKAPFLQAVMTDSMYVLLEADDQTAAVVEYGLTSGYGSQASTESTEYSGRKNYVHNIKLTNLSPNTEYHYSVTHGGTTSADKTFWTAAEPGTSYRFGFMADSRTGKNPHGDMAALMDTFDPRMIVFGGDTNNEATWNSWTREFFLTEQEALNAEVPFANATGNHEGWNALTRAFTQGPTAEGESNGYYSFDYGDTHFLILNTQVSYSQGSAQWNFAAADLAASTQPWKIVSYHKPAYCSGGHGEDGGMKAMTTAIFEPNGVDMTLTGHSHFYQHNLVNGIHHMVLGSVGAPLADPGTASYTLYTEKTYNLGVFDMTPTTLDMTTYRRDGTIIETLHLVKDSTPPTAPTDLSATAVSESQIDLGWTAADDPETGIDHYNIYRDSQLIDSTTSTSYSDTGLSEGFSYTYEVSAVNGDMAEGPRSAAVIEQTQADTTPPTLDSVSATSETTVAVVFSEPVDETSAELFTNYAIEQGIGISSATLQADTETVVLTVSALSQGVTYTLTVNNVTDRATTPNPIVPNTQQTFEYVSVPLVAYWALDEESGTTAVDSSGNGNDGTLKNGAAFTEGGRFGGAVRLDGLDDYVQVESSVAPTPPLGLETFTLATWFKRAGAGDTVNTGTGGFVGEPLITKGRGEVDQQDNRDLNYFLGLTQSGGNWVLAADFEEYNNSQNYPVFGSTAISDGQWHHAAATYDGSQWNLYLDGNPDGTVVVNKVPNYESIQYAAIGGALDSNGVRDGAFKGMIDEVYILEGALSPQGIIDLMGGVAPETVTFQQGVGGYAGTLDTYLLENSPDADNATATALIVDTDEPAGTGGAAQALIRFDGIFGSGPDQIPLGAEIVSAQLELQVFNQGNSFTLHRMGQSWTDAATWNSFGADGAGGVQAGSEAAAAADAATGAVSTGTLSIDIAASLEAWVANPSTNFGWVMLPTGTDGVDFDSAQGSTPPTLSVTFLPGTPNNPPVAVDDAYSVNEDGSLVVDAANGVLANDSDPEEAPMTAILVSDVTNGTLNLSSDGSFNYTPDPDFFGDDSFTYKANDGYGNSNDATVTITVNALPDAPVAVNDVYGAAQDTTLIVDAANGLLANDSDADNDPLTAELAGDVSNGTLNLNTDGSFDYMPAPGYTGPDSFTYRAFDGGLYSNVATVDITVTGFSQYYALSETTTTGTVVGSYFDTQASDNVYEELIEALVGPKSILAHTWTFDITGGSSVSFHVEAWHDGTEDDFVFQYSTDGSTWTDMLTVTKTSDDDTAQTYDLPSSLSGTVYVRVIDTNHRGNKRVLDMLYVDEMFILVN